jgi:DNA-binding CsgD family transcriptional regulator
MFGPQSEMKVEITLSERDIKIIRMLCEDKSVKELWHEYGVSRSRWTQLVTGLKDKMGFRGRIGVVAFAFRNKLVK